MSTNKPEPYAPDLFSEHARLAQLGARVLEILREDGAKQYASTLPAIRSAARSLGLLPTEAKP